MAVSQGHELRAIDIFLTTKLAGFAPLTALIGANNVWADLAPEGKAPPFVTFQFLSGDDRTAFGTERILNISQYVVKAVTEGVSYQQAAQIATQAELAIIGQQQMVTIDGFTYHVQGCYRLRPIRFPEVKEGVRYNHVGGVFRIFIHAT